MQQILDHGESISFGQSLEEAEKLFSCPAVDNPLHITRKGMDKSIEIEDVSLDFDSGRLLRIHFQKGYLFRNPPTPYPEEWKNFPVLGSRRIRAGMSREAFLDYLVAWEERASSSGAERTEMGDLTAQQYAIASDEEYFVNMICVNMGPARRAGGGGIWCDGWNALFATSSGQPGPDTKVGPLESLSAFRDEFNTVARRMV